MNTLKKLKPLWLILLLAAIFISYDIIDMLIFNITSLFVPIKIINSNIEWIECVVVIFQIIIYFIAYIKFFKQNSSSKIQLSSSEGIIKSIIIGLGISGIIIIWNIVVDISMYNIKAVSDSMKYLNETNQNMVEHSYIASLLSIGILGPIVEEILVRGLIFNSLEKIYNKPWFAIIISSLLFGIWHGNFVQGVYTFIMALFVSFIYYKTRTLKWPILIHITINSLDTLPPCFYTEITQNIINITCFIMIIPTLYIIYKLTKNKKDSITT